MQISLAARLNQAIAMRTRAEVDALLRDSRPWLYRLALAITARTEIAEDVVQEALVRAARSRDKLASAAEPRAWLRTVVVRCAITALAKVPAEPQADRPCDADPTEALAVRHTLGRLNPADQAILALAHFEELSYAEIGQALDIPVGTVASRLHAAREAFRKEWRK